MIAKLLPECSVAQISGFSLENTTEESEARFSEVAAVNISS